MKIIVTGATGLIGSRLVQQLVQREVEVVRFVRRAAQPIEGVRDVVWNVERGEMPSDEIENCTAVIHLAGENVADGRWTEEKKRQIRESRVRSTRLLAEAMRAATNRPAVFLSASAIGFYGSRADEVLTEASSAGDDFLARVCVEWEAAAQPVIEAGVRVAFLRFGVVLSPEGGALAKLLTPFKLGLGGKVGTGEQFVGWISLRDAVQAMLFALDNQNINGAINLVAPHPVTNAELSETLARVVRRPSLFTVPAFAARLAFGEMADNALLASQRAMPQQLLNHNFKFQDETLEQALRAML